MGETITTGGPYPHRMRLKGELALQDMLLKELAYEVGVSAQYISKLVRGRIKSVPEDTQHRISTVLSVPTEELFPEG